MNTISQQTISNIYKNYLLQPYYQLSRFDSWTNPMNTLYKNTRSGSRALKNFAQILYSKQTNIAI